MKKKSMNLFLRSISVLIFLTAFAGIAAASCWDNDYDQTACQADDSCMWQDPWCEEKGCWNNFNEDGCDNSNMSCQWYTGNAMGWCEDLGCWSYDNTNQTACETTSGLDCTWNTECFGPWEMGCWDYSDSTSCASAGCDWGGMCFEKGCNQYSSSLICLASEDDCSWNSEWDYCYEAECWDYSDNESYCNSAPGSCSWDSYGMYCYEPSCWSYDYDETSCNNASGLDCTWNDPWCEEQGCWSNGDSGSCETAGCNWRTDNFNTGWCGDVGCWSFDNIT
ncbi:MAG: hypothetical protein KAI26_06050, partial [Nanoarchaeota archaeon]|nr:hypothetical protein [Nanoarchaeota archaeon]